MLWFHEWCRVKNLRPSDRTYHEVKVLAEVFRAAGCVDQLNTPSLVSFEILGRRLQSVIDAYQVPDKVSWLRARHFSGQGSIDDVAPDLQLFVNKEVKGDNENVTARFRANALAGGARGAAAVEPDGGDADDAVAPPAARNPGRGGARGGGRRGPRRGARGAPPAGG